MVQLTPGQASFVRRLAAQTGLNTKFLQAWVGSEEGFAGGPASQRERQGNFNWLNIGPGKVYHSVNQAVDATVHTLNNGLYGQLLKSARTGDPYAQASALVASPWDAAHYHGGGGLRKLIGEVQPLHGGASASGPGQNAPGGARGRSVTVSVPGQQQGSSFDPGAGADNTGLISALLQQQSQAPAYSPSAVVPDYSGRSGGRSPQIASMAPQTGSGDLLSLLGQADFSLPQGQQSKTPGVTVTGTIPGSPGAGASHAGHASHGGLATFDGKPVASWIAPVLQFARQHGWKGTVTSGYRSFAQQKQIYDSGVRPAAVPGQSNHERTGFLQGAVDVTDAQTLNRILQQKHSRLTWAGARDPVHFSVPRNGTY